MRASDMVLVLSLGSLIAQIWLMIFRMIPRNDLFVWGFFVAFAVMAFFAAAVRNADK